MSNNEVIDLCSDKEDDNSYQSPKRQKLDNISKKEDSTDIKETASLRITDTSVNSGSTINESTNSEKTLIQEKKPDQKLNNDDQLDTDDADELLVPYKTEAFDAPQNLEQTENGSNNSDEQSVKIKFKVQQDLNGLELDSSPASFSLKVESDHESIDNDGKDNDAKDNDSKNNDAKETNKQENGVAPISCELPEELILFFKQCKNEIKNAKLDFKLQNVRMKAKQASIYVQSEQFKQDLAEFKRKRSDENKDISYVLVDINNKFKEMKNPPEIEDQRSESKRLMLYDTLEKLKAKINILSEEEVDFDAEDNSSYLKYVRYCEKAASIVKKIAKIEDTSPYRGIAYFSRLDFSKSTYQEFNNAINKKYRNREDHTFPTYYELEKLFKKSIKKHNLNIKETDLKREVEFCFKELGRLLKRRRQKDLEMIHSFYIPSLVDPAKSDAQLEEKLQQNKREGKTKLTNVFEKYAVLQDSGVNPELSEDTDDSLQASEEESNSE